MPSLSLLSYVLQLADVAAISHRLFRSCTRDVQGRDLGGLGGLSGRLWGRRYIWTEPHMQGGVFARHGERHPRLRSKAESCTHLHPILYGATGVYVFAGQAQRYRIIQGVFWGKHFWSTGYRVVTSDARNSEIELFTEPTTHDHLREDPTRNAQCSRRDRLQPVAVFLEYQLYPFAQWYGTARFRLKERQFKVGRTRVRTLATAAKDDDHEQPHPRPHAVSLASVSAL
jgi:hypothetical protein